jgi:hypothetical protein
MSRRIQHVASSILVGVIVLAALAYIARDSVSSFMFGLALDQRRGFHCSHPTLRVTRDFQRISVAAFACELGTSPVARFDTGPATIVLRGIHAERVEVEAATLDYRPRDTSHVQMNTLGDLTQVAGISTNFVKSMLDASEMYSLNAPIVVVNELSAKRAGKLESRMHGLRRSTRELWDRTQIQRLDPAGQALVSVRNLDMEVTPSRGHMSASIRIGGEPGVELHLRGEALNTPRPRMQLSL